MLGYTVYRTTNKLNGMFYIGVHKTADPNDDYLGSGKRLGYAIKKYGVENFVKEVLYSFETKDGAYSKEKELVTEELLDSGACYNLALGGDGGWDCANKVKTPTDRVKSGSIGGKSYAARLETDSDFRKSQIDRFSDIQNRLKITRPNFQRNEYWLGKVHSEESKQKIRESSIGKHEGSKNSQFGSKWITDGISNKKIKKDQEIPNGFRNGRT